MIISCFCCFYNRSVKSCSIRVHQVHLVLLLIPHQVWEELLYNKQHLRTQKHLVLVLIQRQGEDKAASDIFWSIVGLASMVTIRSVPETSGDKSLGDAEDSGNAYSCIMMGEDAGGLLCSLTDMKKCIYLIADKSASI